MHSITDDITEIRAANMQVRCQTIDRVKQT